MRKNNPKQPYSNNGLIGRSYKEISEDDFFSDYKKSSRKKRDQRQLRARRKLERYKEDKELARWLDDSHLDF